MMRRPWIVISGFLLAFGVGCGSEVGTPDETPQEIPGLPPRATDPETKDEAPICAEATGQYAATKEPSNVLFLLDRSGSMHIKLPSNDTRWQATKTGFFDLLNVLPASTTAGLMLFPQGDAPVNAYCGIDATLNDVKCSAGWPEPGETARCSAATYTAGVPSALLASSQVQSMKDHVTASDAEFYWGTPLATALTAAIGAQKASTKPGAKSVILLTDGNPTSCGNSGVSNDIANVVAAAQAGVQGSLVRTFVIGLVDSARQAAKAENLSPVAVAGGTARFAGCEATNECFHKLTDATFAADLKKIFEEISLQAFDCTFNLPQATASTDPALVNVQLTDKNGNTQTVSKDPSRQNGWDYLPNGTQIQLYGQACTAMKDEAAKLRIVLGCKTVEKKPTTPPPTR
jgi:hypothetical protein